MAKYVLCCVLGGFLLAICVCDTGFAAGSNYVTVYGGVLTRDSLGRTAKLTAGFNPDYKLLAVALGKHLSSVFSEYLKLGVEGQFVRHLGEHPHGEVNGLMLLRWTRFSWHKSLNTTFAAGAGLSYATDVPELEEIEDRQSDHLLAYLLFEFTFGLPSHSRWSLSTRIHHRSGADGRISEDVYGASNAICLGMSYAF